MSIISFVSVKGSPGVTTLACLVGASWPEGRQVMVVESDPCGGDLTARFHLSSRDGWASFTAAARRSGGTVPVGPHLQQLPGGLDVLVSSRGDRTDAPPSLSTFLPSLVADPEGPWDLLVDLGRLLPGDEESLLWMRRSDVVVLCLRGDAASVVQVRDRAASLLESLQGNLVLAVVDRGGYSGPDIAQFTKIPVVGMVPFDPASAAVVAGEEHRARRLRRSMLVTATARMAAELARASVPSVDSESSTHRTSAGVGRDPDRTTHGTSPEQSDEDGARGVLEGIATYSERPRRTHTAGRPR